MKILSHQVKLDTVKVVQGAKIRGNLMNYLDELKTIIQEDGSQIVVRQGDDKYASCPEIQSNEPAFFENWTYVVECYKVCQIN